MVDTVKLYGPKGELLSPSANVQTNNDLLEKVKAAGVVIQQANEQPPQPAPSRAEATAEPVVTRPAPPSIVSDEAVRQALLNINAGRISTATNPDGRQQMASSYGLKQPLLHVTDASSLADNFTSKDRSGLESHLEKAAILGAQYGGKIPQDRMDQLVAQGMRNYVEAEAPAKKGRLISRKWLGVGALGAGAVAGLENLDKANPRLGLLVGTIGAVALGVAGLALGWLLAPVLGAVGLIAAATTTAAVAGTGALVGAGAGFLGGGIMGTFSKSIASALKWGGGTGLAGVLANKLAGNGGPQSETEASLRNSLEQAAKMGHESAQARGINFGNRSAEEEQATTRSALAQSQTQNQSQQPAPATAAPNTESRPQGTVASTAMAVMTILEGSSNPEIRTHLDFMNKVLSGQTNWDTGVRQQWSQLSTDERVAKVLQTFDVVSTAKAKAEGREPPQTTLTSMFKDIASGDIGAATRKAMQLKDGNNSMGIRQSDVVGNQLVADFGGTGTRRPAQHDFTRN